MKVFLVVLSICVTFSYGLDCITDFQTKFNQFLTATDGIATSQQNVDYDKLEKSDCIKEKLKSCIKSRGQEKIAALSAQNPLAGAFAAKIAAGLEAKADANMEKVNRHQDVVKQCAISLFGKKLKDDGKACLAEAGKGWETKIEAPDVQDLLQKHKGLKLLFALRFAKECSNVNAGECFTQAGMNLQDLGGQVCAAKAKTFDSAWLQSCKSEADDLRSTACGCIKRKLDATTQDELQTNVDNFFKCFNGDADVIAANDVIDKPNDSIPAPVRKQMFESFKKKINDMCNEHFSPDPCQAQ